MSNWTSIHASVEVDIGNAQKWKLFDLICVNMKDENYTLTYDKKLKGSGFEITGSEMNATVTIASLASQTLNPRDRYYLGGCYVITVTGSLRDRLFEETLAEWDRFARKLANFVLRDCARFDTMNAENDNLLRFARIGSYVVDIAGWSKKDRCYKHYVRTRAQQLPRGVEVRKV